MSLHHTSYSMRDSLYNKIARREKSLLNRPVAWLRAKIMKDLIMKPREIKGLKKSEIIYLLMERQFGIHLMEVYVNVKIEQQLAPRHL